MASQNSTSLYNLFNLEGHPLRRSKAAKGNPSQDRKTT